jgi:hypothetical protein
MLTAPEHELMALNKEATELELMEHTWEAYLEVKSERRPSNKKKRRKIEGRVRSGGRVEGRKKRRVVEAFVFEEDDCLCLKKLYDTSVLKTRCLMLCPQGYMTSSEHT